MKKILFASTALVATAGIAAADVDFTGEAGIGFTFVDNRPADAGVDGILGTADDVAMADWQLDHYTTLSVALSGETDGGLGFGANFDITTGTGGGAVDSSSAYIEGGFGKFSAGDVGSAVDAKLGLSDIGYSGLGVDNIAETLVDAGDAGNLMYAGTFGDFGFALSYDFEATENLSVVATYGMGDYDFGLGYDDLGDGTSAFHVKAGASISDFSLNALYSRNSDIDTTAYGITAGYTMGAVAVTAAYSNVDVTVGLVTTSTEGYGLGVAYDLGGGASVNAGVGEVGGTTVADLGIIMLF